MWFKLILLSWVSVATLILGVLVLEVAKDINEKQEEKIQLLKEVMK